MFSLAMKRLWGDLQYLNGTCEKEGEGLFTWANSDTTRGNGLNLKKERFVSDVMKELFPQFFPVKLGRFWHR